MEYGTQIEIEGFWTLQAYNSEFLPKSLFLGGKEKSKKSIDWATLTKINIVAKFGPSVIPFLLSIVILLSTDIWTDMR